MMSWLRKAASPKILINSMLSEESNQNEPPCWVEACMAHWRQAWAVIQCQQQTQFTTGDQVIEVFSHLEQIIALLLTEVNYMAIVEATAAAAASNTITTSNANNNTDSLASTRSTASSTGCGLVPAPIGPVLDYIFLENVFERLFDWAITTGEYTDSCKLNLLKQCESMITQAQTTLLVHKPILNPILKLLDQCSKTPHAEVEKYFVVLLNSICVSISRDSTLLEFFFDKFTKTLIKHPVQNGSSNADGSSVLSGPKFAVFTLLIPYLYRDGNIGQLARDALLLILAVSRHVESVALFIAENSNFCPVLATGLSGLYSMLPRKLQSNSDDWHRITRDDIENCAELEAFHSALEFCNAVVQVSHCYIQNQLLDYIYHGFLVPVMTSALHQTSIEDLIASTAYVQLFFATITEPQLVKIFVRFLLLERHENVSILESLVLRISSNSKLCLVALSLFETLLDLHCEDLMFELIFKYLIPCTHIMVSQTRRLNEPDLYGRASDKFLSLVPECCSHVTSVLWNCSDASLQGGGDLSAVDEDALFAGGGASSAMNDSTTSGDSGVSGCNGHSEFYQGSSDVNGRNQEAEAQEFQIDFLCYYRDASVNVRRCAEACKCWRLPYDGVTPDPRDFRDETVTTSGDSSLSDGSGSPTSPDQSAAKPTSFNRQSSFRASKANSYFAASRVDRLSNLEQTMDHAITHIDLTLGQEDYFALDQLEAETAPQRSSSSDRRFSDNSDCAPQSSPRKFLNSYAMTSSDYYFKLTYEDDSQDDSPLNSADRQHQTSTNPNSSSGSGGDNATSVMINPWILTGWSELTDESTFFEVLDRVRVSKEASEVDDVDNSLYIDRAFDSVFKKEEETGDGGGGVDIDKSVGDYHDKDGQNAKVVDDDQKHKEHQNGDLLDDPIMVESRDCFRRRLASAPLEPSAFPPVYRSSFSSPNLGPFLTVVLHKLENMLCNSLFVNLRLTAVIAKLCHFPQPLLRSLLLNHSFVFQPSIRSLMQILSSIKNRTDAYTRSVEQLELLVLRGRRFLSARDRRYRMQSNITVAMTTPAQHTVFTPPAQQQQYFQNHVTTTAQSSHIDSLFGGKGFKYLHHHRPSHPDATLSAVESGTGNNNRLQISAQLEVMKTKNVVYCAIVLEEFVKELAAISLQHCLLLRQ